MAQTVINIGDPQAIRRYSAALAVDYGRQIWWKNYISKSANSIVQEKVDLESDAGDTIQFDLRMRIRGGGTYGDDVVEGKENSLTFLVDEVKIDQVRIAVDGGGRMSRKRTIHNLRKIMKDAAAEWAAEWHDEVLFAYASGDVGDNEDANFAEAFANNPIEAPDAFHIVYAGGVSAANAITDSMKMDLELVQKVAVKARMLNAENPNIVAMRPVKLSQGEHFLMVMSEHQAYDLRVGSGSSNWLEIQKAVGQRGDTNPIFTAKMGMIDDVVLAKHTGVRRFVDYGAGANVKAARSLFLGAQGLTVAYGSGNGTRMMWDERSADYNNKIAIAAGMIFGAKKTRYKPKGSSVGYDFGVIAIDTAAAPSY